MKASLKTKVSVLIALVFIFISVVSTYLFTSAHSRSIQREIIARGTALSHSLAKAAEAGLTTENLDLINKASHVVRAEDVALAQVYSSIWTVVDAYPFEKLAELPDQDAVSHFKQSDAPFHIKRDSWHDFYSPVSFKPLEKSGPVNIGFVRVRLSSSAADLAAGRAIIINIILSLLITLLAIIAVNILIGRLVIGPVLKLHNSVSAFKHGALPDTASVYSNDEIGELSVEFNKMFYAIAANTEKLIDSEKRIKDLFERVEHAIFRLDNQGNILETSKKFDELCGTVKKFCALFTEDRGIAVHSDLCLQKALSDKLINSEEKIMGKDGSELTVLLSLYPEIDSSGNTKGFDGYFIDITEQKRLKEELLHSEKLKSIGVLAGGVAHEFNNLLTGILGYASMLEDMSHGPAKTSKYVGSIKKSAEMAANLTRQLLGFARKGKYTSERMDIGNLLAELVELLRETVDRNITVAFEVEPDLPPVEGDRDQIYQVLLNLCLNARDAMPEGGKLHIKSELYRLSDDKVVNLFQIPEGEYIRISVTDTGTGMTHDVKTRIFEPFYTTKEVGRGTGLGLSMVYGVIKNHRGHINVYSEPGLGTTIRVFLPGSDGLADNPAKAVPVFKKTRKGTILIIDDEAVVRELGKDILEAYDYEVLLADNGNKGVSVFNDFKDRIDLVLLDIIMPEKGGKQAFKDIRDLKPDAKVVLCTGYGNEQSFDDLFSAGAADFLAKPFQRDELLCKVENLISRT